MTSTKGVPFHLGVPHERRGMDHGVRLGPWDEVYAIVVIIPDRDLHPWRGQWWRLDVGSGDLGDQFRPYQP